MTSNEEPLKKTVMIVIMTKQDAIVVKGLPQDVPLTTAQIKKF